MKASEPVLDCIMKDVGCLVIAGIQILIFPFKNRTGVYRVMLHWRRFQIEMRKSPVFGHFSALFHLESYLTRTAILLPSLKS